MKEQLTGVQLISIERQRQIDKEGWTSEHDDEHYDESLVWAAVCFAAPEAVYTKAYYPTRISFRDPWPNEWDCHWDKRPQNDEGSPAPEKATPEERISLLVKAGALIAAEIDRLQRDQ